MLRRALTVGVVLILATAVRAEGPLAIGDSAPKISVKEFIKGDAVKQFEKGKTYVVEFWATWCPPCRESIPHLTKLQKEHKDVVFIGVSISEQDFDKVKPFVEKMGDKMDYRVAIDSVPAGKGADEGAMNKTWMNAAEQDGIPSAFIVNGDGKIAWIGHPMEMDKPLKEIVAGKWDIKVAAANYKEEKEREKKMAALMEKLQKSIQNKDYKGLVSTIDEVVQADPKIESRLGGLKFNALAKMGDVDAAVKYGRKLIEETFKDDGPALNELAWAVVDPDAIKDAKPDAKVLRVAVEAAKKANELTESKDPNILDTFAQATFLSGNIDEAIKLQEKAVKLNPQDAELKERLESLKQAKNKKKD